MFMTEKQFKQFCKNLGVQSTIDPNTLMSGDNFKSWNNLMRSDTEHHLHDLLYTIRQSEWRAGGAEHSSEDTPPRWQQGDTKYRCTCDNITLESEIVGGIYACVLCNGVLYVTFPEDRPGPIEHVLRMP